MSKPFFSVFLLSLTLASCSTILNHLPGVYTLEIQQGNIVDQDMLNQLKPHMSKRQVLYIMGSPMLKNVFHQSRWDYIYSDKISGQDRVQKRITLVFNGDELVGMQGDLKPEANATTNSSQHEATVNVPKRDLDKTLWEKITGIFDFVRGNSPIQKDTDNVKPKKTDE